MVAPSALQFVVSPVFELLAQFKQKRYKKTLHAFIGLFENYFFFQAEDGIRDCLLSRGLGDVYKRQRHTIASKLNELSVVLFM